MSQLSDRGEGEDGGRDYKGKEAKGRREEKRREENESHQSRKHERESKAGLIRREDAIRKYQWCARLGTHP